MKSLTHESNTQEQSCSKGFIYAHLCLFQGFNVSQSLSGAQNCLVDRCKAPGLLLYISDGLEAWKSSQMFPFSSKHAPLERQCGLVVRHRPGREET